jgi:predicted nucleic acid-binding Zn ribbon protein
MSTAMATYLYETIPSKPGEEPVTFEVVQSMKDSPLTHHPETGIPVRRVITGGYGFVSKGGAAPAPAPPASGGGCGSGCGCHH